MKVRIDPEVWAPGVGFAESLQYIHVEGESMAEEKTNVLTTDYRGEALLADAKSWAHEASVYHRPTEDAIPRHEIVNQACQEMLKIVLQCCPPSRDRTIALNKVREARMWANSAIATEGRL
jgi:hypothetical protein